MPSCRELSSKIYVLENGTNVEFSHHGLAISKSIIIYIAYVKTYREKYEELCERSAWLIVFIQMW